MRTPPVGEETGPGEADIEGVREGHSWGEIYPVDERTAVTAAEIAAGMGSQGPFISGMNVSIAAGGRELDAPVVSTDRVLTHPETKRVVDVEEYSPGPSLVVTQGGAVRGDHGDVLLVTPIEPPDDERK